MMMFNAMQFNLYKNGRRITKICHWYLGLDRDQELITTQKSVARLMSALAVPILEHERASLWVQPCGDRGRRHPEGSSVLQGCVQPGEARQRRRRCVLQTGRASVS